MCEWQWMDCLQRTCILWFRRKLCACSGIGLPRRICRKRTWPNDYHTWVLSCASITPQPFDLNQKLWRKYPGLSGSRVASEVFGWWANDSIWSGQEHDTFRSCYGLWCVFARSALSTWSSIKIAAKSLRMIWPLADFAIILCEKDDYVAGLNHACNSDIVAHFHLSRKMLYITFCKKGVQWYVDLLSIYYQKWKAHLPEDCPVLPFLGWWQEKEKINIVCLKDYLHLL